MRPSLVLLVCLLPTLSAPAVEARGTIAAVVDGDSLSVALDGRTRAVRLLYVDAPTIADNDPDAPLAAGGSAREHLAELLPVGSAVVLWSPAADFARDARDRLLAVVTCRAPGGGPEIVQELLVRAGWSAYWHGHGAAPDPLHSVLLGAHESARMRRVGLWPAHGAWLDAGFIGHRASATGSVPATAERPAGGDARRSHWLNTGSDTRHNRDCRWYQNTKDGRPCGPQEGQACRECGG